MTAIPPLFVVTTLNIDDPLLEQVKRLGNANKQTLGFFPDGAFDEHAARGLLIVAVDARQCLAGYAIYRSSPDQSAALVHLCTHPEFRGKGVSAYLLAALDRETAHLKGVGLWCRNDFPAHLLWPRFGFIARKERIGRSKAGHRLTYWWKGNGAQDLLSGLGDDARGHRISAAIDANVFFDLLDDVDSDSAGLNLDWLRDEVDLAVCPELYNEIIRDSDKARRDKCRAFARQFTEVAASPDELLVAVSMLTALIPPGDKPQDRSDLKQLAYAVAGGAKVFVTRDDRLLASADEVYGRCLVSVVRPAELVTRIDALLREEQYQRNRLAGTSLVVSREETINESALAQVFQESTQGERKNAFLGKIHRLRADPENAAYSVVRDQNGLPIGLIGHQRSANGTTNITVLRAKAGSIRNSLLRYLVSSLLLSEPTMTEAILLSDPYAPAEVIAQLASFGFVRTPNGMAKASISGSPTSADLLEILKSRIGACPAVDQLLVRCIQQVLDAEISIDKSALLILEKILWPLEIRDMPIPCFIIPIRPMYAKHLFDVDIASGDLFGAQVDLALNQEAVYYRSPKNSRGLAAPARLLWYVSGDTNVPGSAKIRAYSRLEEVEVGPAKDIFRKYRRIGIFGHKEVLNSAGGNIHQQLMAIRFSSSQQLENPIPWASVQTLMKSFGINSTLISPTRIPPELYFKIKEFHA